MEETPKLRPLDAGTFDPKRWLGAVVGGVVLGEALWSMLQLLIRDWATPAVMNLLGQGPTQNREAFLPQPLLLAFVEVCLAGILLVLIFAWTNRGRRVVRVSVARASTKERAPAAPTPVAAPPIVPATGPLATSVREQTPPAMPQPVPRTEATETQPSAFSPAPESVATPTRTIIPPLPAAPVAAVPAESAQAKPKSKPKKPKPVYYNIVGEPVESDDE
ncbi:MAG TPA: hypothetical protein VEI01_24095 [Terriglobales bacterium]|nr:hypothetical protein [Terriglobales bacterium]